MRCSTDEETRLRELARRGQGPVEVTLLWDPRSGGAVVVVWNWGSGACLRLEVAADQAGFAYAHPYAYAAARGVPEAEIRRVA
ncbi:hypothetical protein ACI797_01760 [Geodermatophilus sp. SYSU D00691]